MKNIIFSAKNLSKQYNDTYVLKDVNLEIAEGEIYGLVGKNGAGKTTLMKIITGLTKKTSGEFSLFGVSDTQNISRKKLGSLIEEPALYENLNAFENLKIQALLTNTYDKNKIYELLELLSLQNAKNKKVFEYSLGMKQRLGLAVALISDPKFLVLIYFFIGFLVNKIMVQQYYFISQRDIYEIGIKILYIFMYTLIYTSIITMLFFIFKNKTIAIAISIFVYIFEFITSDKNPDSITLGTPLAIMFRIVFFSAVELQKNIVIILIPIIIISITTIITSLVFSKRDIEFYV